MSCYFFNIKNIKSIGIIEFMLMFALTNRSL